MAGGGGGGERPLYVTPTWAVAVVCALFLLLSFGVERSLHHLGQWLLRTKRRPLYEALEKVKEELMLLGFLSLFVTVFGPYISKICINSSFYKKHPKSCDRSVWKKPHGSDKESEASSDMCPKGRESVITYEGMEELDKLLFVLGCMHVFYSCMTVILALLKLYTWRKWEDEAQLNADRMPEICRVMTLRRQSTFVAHHSATPGIRNRFFVWVVCFFRQFGSALVKSDYMALRMGFVTKHSTIGVKYDFHSYMLRCVEEDFKDVVGISRFLWLYFVVFMLFNIQGVQLYVWTSILSVVAILLVGTKLQRVIAQLALENAGVSGPLGRLEVPRPRDSLFWFGRPRLMLNFIHFLLFQNSFELARFGWVWWLYGWESCLMASELFTIISVVIGFLVQILCSYSTFPLYAIVTQMGSHYNKAAAFNDEQVAEMDQLKQRAYRNARPPPPPPSSASYSHSASSEMDQRPSSARSSAYYSHSASAEMDQHPSSARWSAYYPAYHSHSASAAMDQHPSSARWSAYYSHSAKMDHSASAKMDHSASAKMDQHPSSAYYSHSAAAEMDQHQLMQRAFMIRNERPPLQPHPPRPSSAYHSHSASAETGAEIELESEVVNSSDSMPRMPSERVAK